MPTRSADLVLRDAPVYRAGRWDGDAVAVRDGLIVAVGEAAHLDPLVGPGTEVRSLAGRWLLPAFHDAHVHPVSGGVEMNQCDLTSVDDIEGYLRLVQEYVDTHDGPWITGGGWSMDSFPGGVPTADLLDRVCPDRPAYLPNRDHHSAWVNTRALELAGIDRHTPDPADGRIERNEQGDPTGALHEGAMGLVAALVPRVTDEQLLEGLLSGQRYLHSIGIAGWQDALVGEGLGMRDSLATYISAKRSGLLTAKVRLALWWDRERGLEQLPELRERRAAAREAGLDAGSVKIMQDGVCETFTAAMLEPYRDDRGVETDNHGLSFIEAAALAEYVAALDAEGFQVHVHALGDRAVRDSLDAFEKARAANGPSPHRHHLAHLQVIDPADVGRFAALDVTANAQPLWACRDDAMERLTLPFLSDTAQAQQYVFGSLRRVGARLACGSDWPVSPAEPLWGMHVAVNRREPGSDDAEPLLPDEALSVVDAIDAYTTGSTYVNGLDASSGRVEPGYAADFAVVDTDVLGCPPERLGDTTVTHTYVDGVEVCSAEPQ